jgi:hypothetical protein
MLKNGKVESEDVENESTEDDKPERRSRRCARELDVHIMPSCRVLVQKIYHLVTTVLVFVLWMQDVTGKSDG